MIVPKLHFASQGTAPRNPVTKLDSPLADALRDRYVLERELGRGGMATVYLAHDLKHDRQVASKVLRPELAADARPRALPARDRARRASCSIPISSPLLRLRRGAAGTPLVHHAVRRGRVAARPAPRRSSCRSTTRSGSLVRWPTRSTMPTGRASSTATSSRRTSCSHGRPGAGRRLRYRAGLRGEAGGTRLTETGLTLGTPAYMSPEQALARPRLDARSDIYSLACVLYEMLAGEPPLLGRRRRPIMAKRLGEPVPHLATMRQVPPGVEAAVTKALARAPADRYPSVSQFAHALASSSVSGDAAGSAPLPRSRRLWWTSLAALALLTLLGGWWGASRTRTQAAMRRSVALLPCENTSLGPEAAYIGDRWSEELIQKLVRVGGLNPTAWASVRRYRDSPLALRRIGAELHAGTLVRCRVAELPTGTDLGVQLIRADDERVIWSNDYDRPAGAEGINAAQSAAARDIAQELGVTLPAGAVASVERPLTRDTVALRLYRLGIHYLQFVDDPASIRKSLDDFEGAIARDTSFAQAYVGLAEAMIWRGQQESLVSRTTFRRRRSGYDAPSRWIRRSPKRTASSRGISSTIPTTGQGPWRNTGRRWR